MAGWSDEDVLRLEIAMDGTMFDVETFESTKLETGVR
jgi:hypothetical protein